MEKDWVADTRGGIFSYVNPNRKWRLVKNNKLDAEIEKKIDDLLAQMTVEEKVGQLNQYNGTWDLTGLMLKILGNISHTDISAHIDWFVNKKNKNCTSLILKMIGKIS